jgi:transcription elongation factor Elf1
MLMESALVLTCPHCGQEQADDWEVLEASEDHELRCESCGKAFHARIVECPRCVADNVLIGEDRAPEAEGVACKSCGSPLVVHGEEADDCL